METIISPLLLTRKIRQIINDLGKGIIHKVNYSESRDEIGQMVASVNNLSEKEKRKKKKMYWLT